MVRGLGYWSGGGGESIVVASSAVSGSDSGSSLVGLDSNCICVSCLREAATFL